MWAQAQRALLELQARQVSLREAQARPPQVQLVSPLDLQARQQRAWQDFRLPALEPVFRAPASSPTEPIRTELLLRRREPRADPPSVSTRLPAAERAIWFRPA